MSTNAAYILDLTRARLAGEPFEVIGLKIGDVVRGPEEGETAGPSSGESSWLEVMIDGRIYKISAQRVDATYEQTGSWLKEWNKHQTQGRVF